jgi:hypothetical protein
LSDSWVYNPSYLSYRSADIVRPRSNHPTTNTTTLELSTVQSASIPEAKAVAVWATMSQDAQNRTEMDTALTETRGSTDASPRPSTSTPPFVSAIARSSNAQYRSRPVSVAVDPVPLVISECISVTSAMRKHARWAGSSVSSILGGNPNPIQLGPPSPLLRPGSKSSAASIGIDGTQDIGVANRWGLRGKKGKSMQDNPLMAGFGRLRHELSSCKGNEQPAHEAGQQLSNS